MEQIILAAVAALAAGIFAGKIIFKGNNDKLNAEAKEKADQIIKDARSKQDSIKKEKILEAREKFIQMKSDFDEDLNKRKQNITIAENKIKQKEQTLSKQLDQNKREKAELDSQKEVLDTQVKIVNKKKDDLDELKLKEAAKLEKVANMSKEDAVNSLMEVMQNEAQTRASHIIKNIEDEAKLTATKNAKKVIIDTIQRTAAETAVENCVSIFNLESDDIKGKIIGREGRNIRALEAATGVEIIVDDTPEAIIISGHDPVRREVARLSLHRLVTDGRIHPARIEEVVKKTFKDINEEIIEIGERTAIDLSIHGLHPELIRMVGRMRFRSSYGQNLLQHSREVANMCAIMAAELGLNVKKAKRAGLLHDIGKVAENTEKPHAIIGMELAQKHGEHPEIVNAIGAHHDEIEMTSIISPIVQSCDAISGARPGARREVMESYIQRWKDLENKAY